MGRLVCSVRLGSVLVSGISRYLVGRSERGDMPRKGKGRGPKRAGAKKAEAEPSVALTVHAMALT